MALRTSRGNRASSGLSSPSSGSARKPGIRPGGDSLSSISPRRRRSAPRAGDGRRSGRNRQQGVRVDGHPRRPGRAGGRGWINRHLEVIDQHALRLLAVFCHGPAGPWRRPSLRAWSEPGEQTNPVSGGRDSRPGGPLGRSSAPGLGDCARRPAREPAPPPRRGDLGRREPAKHQQHYATIPPQMQLTQSAYVGDVWHLVSQSSGSLIGTVSTTPNHQTVVVS